MATASEDDFRSRAEPANQGTRYTRVAIWLHWAIAILIIWNLVSGLLIWDLAKEFFQQNRPFYFVGLILHLSAGMTVLALTVVRIIWRLMHEPPAYPTTMKTWERHAAHFAHFLLYAGMVLMPLTGWAILSANPPPGSPGAQVAPPRMAPSPAPAAPGAAPTGPPSARPQGAPPIWFVVPLPMITPIANIGREPGGVEPLEILHDQIAEWHKIGGYLMILLLLLHIGGALKHQYLDREPELQRMGFRRRKPEAD